MEEVSRPEKEEIYSAETGWKDAEGMDFAYGYERLEKLIIMSMITDILY